MERTGYFMDGEMHDSCSESFYSLYDPSTGEIVAEASKCTEQEVNDCIEAAVRQQKKWAKVPVMKRVQVLYRIKQLIDEHIEELTMCVAKEHGKVWDEAKGDILKAREGTELACSVNSLMMGESLMDTSSGYDTVLYREPVGVFAGICPMNFPAMIPFGWMAPVCIACGNAIILKASSKTPRTAYAMAKLYAQAFHDMGYDYVPLNVLTTSRDEAEILLTHPDVKGISFVGSTPVGLHVYGTAAANGKRVQCLTQAKNHALVLNDAPIARTAAGIINSAFGCAGERCMALPVVVAQEEIADALAAKIVELASAMKVGPAYDKTSKLGPVVDGAHMKKVTDYINLGVEEGAELILDGRNYKVPGYENGFYIGPTVFDHVKPGMKVGDEEIFGPVLCIKRVKTFEEGLELMNANPYANGSVIFTQNGYYAREFANRTDGGMVGVNVGIPVPVGVFPFSGHKQSFFGDQHCLGKDGVRFYTESKTVTTRWFDEEEAENTVVSSWDGTIDEGGK